MKRQKVKYHKKEVKLAFENAQEICMEKIDLINKHLNKAVELLKLINTPQYTGEDRVPLNDDIAFELDLYLSEIR